MIHSVSLPRWMGTADIPRIISKHGAIGIVSTIFNANVWSQVRAVSGDGWISPGLPVGCNPRSHGSSLLSGDFSNISPIKHDFFLRNCLSFEYVRICIPFVSDLNRMLPCLVLIHLICRSAHPLLGKKLSCIGTT